MNPGATPSHWCDTGKIVASQLCVTAVISFAIQHLVGTKDSKEIFAIKRGGEALIVSMTESLLDADLLSAVLELVAAL